MQTVREQKSQLRLLCRERRSAMPAKLREKADADIFRSAWELVGSLGFPDMYVYVSSPGLEVDTIRLIDAALSGGVSVIVPKCVGETASLEHYEIKSRSQLKKGCFGIMEPDEEKCRKRLSEHKGVCIVPGLAFDSRGCRMGWGKGYYDRFLSFFEGVKIGLCYESCFFEKDIPSEEHDAVMDYIITENAVRKINNASC